MTLNYVTVDKQKGSSTALKNNLVVVLFFKPDESGTSDALKIVSSEISSLGGVKALGVFLSSDDKKLIQMISSEKLDFPIHFDPRSGGIGVARQFEVRLTPWCVLLDPDGRMVGSLPPAQLPERLRQQLKLTPPRQTDAAVISVGNDSLKLAERFLKTGNPRAAIRAMSTLPADARTDPNISDRLSKVTIGLDEAIPKLIEASEKLIEAGKLGSATVLLQQMSSAMDTTPSQAKILEQLQSITDDPELKSKSEKQRPDAVAEDTLNESADHEGIGDEVTAFTLLNDLITTYPSSPAASTAKKRLADWEADPAKKRRLYDAMQGAKANPMLKSAESFIGLGLKDRARTVLEQLFKEYPNTTAAEKGKELLKKL